MTTERRIKELEEDVAKLKARYVATLGVLQVLVLRLDNETFRTVIELLDIPVPSEMGPAATREADHFFSELSEHLMALREKMSNTEE